MEDTDTSHSLVAGWWRTKAGWKLALRTDGTDPLAKPLVIVAVLALFLLAAYVLNWRLNWIIGQMAAIVVIAVVIAGPSGEAKAHLEPGWWKTTAGWLAVRRAPHDDPALRPIVFAAATLFLTALLAVNGTSFGGALVVSAVFGLALSIAIGAGAGAVWVVVALWILLMNAFGTR